MMRMACALTLAAVAVADSSMSMMDVVAREGSIRRQYAKTPASLNSTHSFDRMMRRQKEFRSREEPERRERMINRRERSKNFLQRIQPDPAKLELVGAEEFERMDAAQKKRGLSWFGGGQDTDAYSTSVLADPSQYYDMWAQSYRMLGGFIDCDHDWDGDGDHNSGGSGDNNGNGQGACSRWMMWAAYVNPNYQGNGYYEYYGDEPYGKLDCHSPDTEWELLGVYRQEFYQFIEQISKHLWSIDEYEYVVALAGLAYMTDYECFAVGDYDSDGNAIYASIAPKPYGKFEMALYTDEYCLTPNDNLGKTFDDYGLTSDIYLGSKDETDDDSYGWAYDDWYGTQEYTLTNLNDVYESFKYCTSCVDYPTYQDGYFIGDDGTDEDDLINQCWKFYSHDSYTCEAECISMAHAQGTILSVKYGEATFGKTSSGFYSTGKGSSESKEESAMTRLLANAFLTISFILFIATFLAFAVARRSRYRESRSSRTRRLLDDDNQDHPERSRKSRRSKSRGTDGDGIYRSSRSKSAARKSSSKSRSRSRNDRKKRRSKSSGGQERRKDGDEYF